MLGVRFAGVSYIPNANHHYRLSPTFFHRPKQKLCTRWATTPIYLPPTRPCQTLVYILSQWTCLFWRVHTRGIMQRVAFRVSPPRLSIMCSRFVHLAAGVRTLLFVAMNDTIPLSAEATLCFSIRRFMDTWLFPLFGHCEKCWCGHLSTSVGPTARFRLPRLSFSVAKDLRPR